MYKSKYRTGSNRSGRKGSWIKRKIILILTAFMLGMSNAMYDETKMVDVNQHRIEQEKEKE